MGKQLKVSEDRREFLKSLGKWSGIVTTVFVGMAVAGAALPMAGCSYSKYSKYSDYYYSYYYYYYYSYCAYSSYYGYYYCYKDQSSNYVNYSDYVDGAG